MPTTRTRLYEIFASIFVAVILVSQIAIVLGASFFKIPGTGGKRFWPIVSYHMYSESHFAGETIEVRDLLEGTRSDGTVVAIDPEDLSLNLWDFRHLVQGLKSGDDRAVTILRSRYADSAALSEVRILSYPLMLTHDGPAPKASEVLARIPLQSQTASVRSE